MRNFKQFFRENSDINAFLISKPENIFYLTGFQGSFGYFLALKSGKCFLITDSRYAEVAENLAKINPLAPLSGGNKSKLSSSFPRRRESSQSRIPFRFLLFDKDFAENIKSVLSCKTPSNSPLSGGELKVAIENSATLAQKDYWQEIFPQISFQSQDKIIEGWRAIKNTSELQKTRKACLALNKVFDDISFFRGILTAGASEKEVAFQLEMKLRDNGKYELSFPIMVAFGENSAIPHHNPGERRLKSRENILIDCGVKFENYCSDMTRNFYLGSPKEDYLENFERLLAVQEKTLQEYKIGTELKKTEDFCRQKLGNLASFFTHSLGHGVGLEIHELPSFSKKEQAVFQSGQVVTCEPGVYFPRKFGIRIEDQILITDNGSEILTKTSKELIVL